MKRKSESAAARRKHIDKRAEDGPIRALDYGSWLLSRVLIGLAVLVVASTLLVHHFMRVFEGRPITYGQSLIFVVQTITTTGYGELLPFESYPMKILAVVLMFLGVTLIFMFGGTLMAVLIERRLARPVPTRADLAGHVIFTGYNETIDRIISLLRQHGVPYVVAASDQAEGITLEGRRITCVVADPERDEGMEALGIQRARLVVASQADARNFNVILGASAISATPILAVMSSEKAAGWAVSAGAARVITPHAMLGRMLVDWIVADPSPTEFIQLVDVQVSPEVLEQLQPSIFHVGADSPLKGLTVRECHLRTQTGATIVAIWNADGTVTSPTADTVIDESTLIVMGARASVAQLASELGGPGPGDHVILAGVGEVGQMAGSRLNEAGLKPHVIDVADRQLLFDGRLIAGDSTERRTLQQAGIEDAETLIVALNSDSLAILTILAARELNPEINVVARAERAETVERLLRAGASHVLSESLVGSQLLQVALIQMGLLPKPAELVVREIPWTEEETTIEQFGADLHMIAVARNGTLISPTADFTMERGDRLVVMGPPDRIDRMVWSLPQKR